ncbi:MAG: hypothetical protein EA424_03680 [Planctomycetaceae bacterium]|nr:MAG: hypothetical protein EA424_03680 [Planctomycetaceae bacterium]
MKTHSEAAFETVLVQKLVAGGCPRTGFVRAVCIHYLLQKFYEPDAWWRYLVLPERLQSCV